MLNKKKIKLFFLVCLFFFFLSPGFVFALEINYPQIPGAAPPQDFIQTASPEQILPLYVLYIFNLTIWLSGIIAFGVLIYAGILYLTAAGKPEKIISARNQISNAFLGILLLLSSFLILRVLNTQLVVLEIPEPEPIEGVERPETPSPPAEFHLSSIDTEISFANIISERIGKERMSKVKNNATTTADIADTLKNQVNDLNNSAQQCYCGQANTKSCPQCPGCADDCTCDTCKNQRGTIENLEKKNLEKLDELKAEQEKTIEEIRLLNIELDRLEKAEAFMLSCPLPQLNSLAQFLGTKKFYLSNKWPIFDAKFLEEIITIEDWANFYCPVSGTIWGGEQPPAESTTTATTTGLSYVEVPQEAEEAMACTTEMPIGEIIDRTKRVGRLLVKRMEKLVEKDKEMIEAVDEMHVLVSQCSSQKPRCCTKCILVCGPGGCRCVIVGCVGAACPFTKISQQAEKIAEIQEQINDLVYRESDKKEEIGIVPIIDKVVSKLLEDLDKLIRKPMKQCISEISPEMLEGQPQVILSACESALRTIGPKGKIIENCCLNEPEFQTCLDKCYLEEGQEKYKKCLEECLIEKAEELKNSGKTREGEIIATCRHKINFYCCGK